MDFIVVFYDKWIFDENYRKLIAEQMGLEFNDSNNDKVIGFGSSSFQPGVKKINEDFRKKLTERYKIFQNDEYYIKNVLEDEELKMLWDKVKNKFDL